ncbi:drug/metabolite transporter [Rhizoctonia solani AG-3 Rhs1AP]|uniref:Drug/metabolite transporter n=1 Tax=Rhizoctonia solani AG-3 Rhs1AP TaxID=1086054 RepID=X8J6L2_9AGAM|nr:drug/metabolite transporter [Rhizoctonia solani AG-3 Rhs1AP]
MANRPSQSIELSPSERHILIPPPMPAEDNTTSGPNRFNAVKEFVLSNKGLFIIAASQFFFSLMNLSVKFLTAIGEPVPTLEIVCVRMLITYVCCQAYMFAAGVPDPILGPKGVRKWLVIRGVVGFFGLFGLYYSLHYMSLSDATVLTFLAPTVTAVLGFLFLHEAVSWKQMLAGLTSLVGVVLIARPTSLFGGNGKTDTGSGAGGPTVTEAERMVAVAVAMLGVLGASCAYVSLRVIGKRAHPMHTMSYFSLWCVLVSVVGGLATHSHWVLPRQWTWIGMLIIVGLFGFLAQLLLTLGLQRETASRGTMVLYIQIVFSLVFERVAFGVSPSGLSVLGTCVIIASAIYVALNKPSKETNTPANTESTAMWDMAPAAKEGRGLLDGDEHKEELEPGATKDGINEPVIDKKLEEPVDRHDTPRHERTGSGSSSP